MSEWFDAMAEDAGQGDTSASGRKRAPRRTPTGLVASVVALGLVQALGVALALLTLLTRWLSE